MTNPTPSLSEQKASRRVIDSALRLGLVALMIGWSFMIFKLFVMPVLWAGIIAVAVQPLYLRFERWLGGKRKLALTLFTLLALGLLLVPTFMLANSSVESAQAISEKLDEGGLQVPPPPASVAEWPLVGERVHKTWTGASTNLPATIKKFAPQIKEAGKWVLGMAAGAGAGLLQFVFAIVIAAHYNERSRPFVWTASAESLLAKIERLCSYISGTTH